jgi:hypothetical protein
MKSVFPTEWRTQNRRKRRFYAKYMAWIEKIGYGIVLLVFAAFIVAFNYKVDDLVTADGVKIEPNATVVNVEAPTLVVRSRLNDFDEVHKGQPVMEVVEGLDEIRAYQAWSASPAAQKPKTCTLTAPADGTLRLESVSPEATIEPGDPLFKVVDYRDLRVEASFTGQTVPQAKVGQVARLTGISAEPGAGTLFRGSGSASPIVSGRLVGDELRSTLDRGLKGQSISLRDDVPLQVEEVTGVEVDAIVDGSVNAAEANLLQLDPPSDFQLQAQVVEGAGTASVQLADLPPALAKQAADRLRESLRQKSVRQVDGSAVKLDDLKDVRMVVKLKAVLGGASGTGALAGVALSRSFDAKLKIVDPPATISDLVRAADRAGKFVTARAELRTGTRPIAFLLLRKS